MNNEYHRVKGHDDLRRDPKTNSIINTNVSEYNQYVTRRKLKNKENEKIENLEKDLSDLKNDIDEIKSLLISLTSNTKS